MTDINAVLIKVDGTVEHVTIDNSDGDKLRQLVGGFFEAIGGDGWVAWLDEDGKFKDNATVNMKANVLVRMLGWPGAHHDMLVGDVVFTGPGDSKGDTTTVTDTVLQYLEAL